MLNTVTQSGRPTMVLIFALIWIFFMGYCLILGTVVYKDAKRNNLSPVLWTLVALLVPNFLGLIIYLIVRSTNKKKSTCPNCSKPVEIDFQKCPFCGADIHHYCPSCNQILSPEWSTCPFCSHKVGDPLLQKKKDKSLLILIGTIIAIFIIGAIVMLGGMVMFLRTGGPSSNLTIMSHENSSSNSFDISAQRLYGRQTHPIKCKESGTLEITGFFSHDGGQLEVYLEDEQGNHLYDFTNDKQETIALPVDKGDRILIVLEGEKANDVESDFSWELIN